LKLTRFIATAALLLMVATGCHHSTRTFRPSIDPELIKMTKEQVFDRGEQFFARKRFPKARTYYSYVYENSPNDPLGRRALLRVADTYYAQADPVNLVEAQYKYRDFINRYPGSDRADYAMLQIANVAYLQMDKPDRDQQKTHEAVEKYQDMLRAYPKSSLRPEAEKRLGEAFDRMARHEHLVAKYYLKRGSFNAAMIRLNGVVEQYPNYRDRDSVFFDLGTALERLGRKPEARLYFERVVSEFPQSQYASKARKHLDTIKA
jgi:outer membrane protein assembly factor BamD